MSMYHNVDSYLVVLIFFFLGIMFHLMTIMTSTVYCVNFVKINFPIDRQSSSSSVVPFQPINLLYELFHLPCVCKLGNLQGITSVIHWTFIRTRVIQDTPFTTPPKWPFTTIYTRCVCFCTSDCLFVQRIKTFVYLS